MVAQVIFVLLQLADIGTTIFAIRLGGVEKNSLVTHLFVVGTLQGLLFSKVLVLAVAVAAVMAHRARILRLANVVYAGVVAWNLSIILRLLYTA